MYKDTLFIKNPICAQILKGCSQEESVRALWLSAKNLPAAIAIWRLPKSNELHLLIDFSSKIKKAPLNIEGGLSGFAISPFTNQQGNETLLLRPDIHICFQNKKLNVLSEKTIPPDFWGTLKENILNKDNLPPRQAEETPPQQKCGKTHYTKTIEKALAEIKNTNLEKVVVARTLIAPKQQKFDVIKTLFRLINAQDNTFISLFSLPDKGTWLGASPELLAGFDKGTLFRTVSLAATQSWKDGSNHEEAVWNQKEIEEQAMVNRYITEQFKAIHLSNFTETGPRSVRAGSLIHLKTEYQVNLRNMKSSTIADSMLKLLHPTSAVCGMPKQAAQEFIARHEDFDREFYGGYLGSVNMNNKTRLYVNLRCAQIFPSHLVFYAGAGITHHSHPEEEWNETTLKCKMLMDIINDA